MSGQNESEKITIERLSVTYNSGGKATRAVKDCSFELPKGRVVGLVGESGSGKTSALMAIPGLLPAGTLTSGVISLDGMNLAALKEDELAALRWRRIALVPQGAMNSFTPHITIGRHITEVLSHHLKIPPKAGQERAAELLSSSGLDSGLIRRYPHELSGGQKQRAALALALACEPDFLLADEPTTALDVITQKEVLDTIVNIVRERGMGLLLVTHDLPLAAGICDGLIVMKDGEIAENGTARQVSENPRHPYTRLLIDSIREMDVPR
jgi:ABC-type glutathione transport system ATPase component